MIKREIILNGLNIFTVVDNAIKKNNFESIKSYVTKNDLHDKLKKI